VISVGAQALGSLLENSEMRLTESQDRLDKSKTYKDQVEAGLLTFSTASKADIAARKASLVELERQFDEIGGYDGSNTQQVALGIMQGIRELIERPLYLSAARV
jgi:hypothetical protein